MRWLAGRLALWLCALLLLTIAGIGSLMLATLPRMEGSIRLAGPQAAIDIGRDDVGVVTIRAGSELDAAFALGFVHAQDRLLQMDLTRRLGAGRLSEIIGPATVSTDTVMRTLGLYHLAEAQLEALPQDLRSVADAYCAGVNAFLDQASVLPPEFALLRYR